MATPNNGWAAPSPQPMAQQAGADEFGVQTRPMGLKVLYSFDRDNQIQCLARWPHILQVQTMPLDDRTSIGVVDLRTCLQAVAQCSPEIVNQHDTDYSIYATDFSEQDWPLVGQGMLSWGLDQHPDPQQQPQQQQQLVTGRVTRNLMALLSNGSRETLEVKLKLTAVAKRNDFAGLDSLNLGKFVSTAGDTGSEWNSFLQSNPMLGHTGNVASMPSPALPPAQYNNQPESQNSMPDQRYMDHGRREAPLPQPDHMRRDSLPPHPDHMRRDSLPPHPNHMRQDSLPPQPDHMRRDAPSQPSRGSMPPQGSRPGSVPPPPVHEMPPTSRPMSNLVPLAAAGPQRNGSPAIAPRPGDLLNKPPPVSQPSRPASRTRIRPSTGRPRGRPRKKVAEPGSTSAAEEATDGDDGPQKKRAKVVKTEYSLIAPFGSAPDSLRVAASTSGTLRTMRPAGSAAPMEAGHHLQDVPRAPTPVPGPNASLLQKQPKRKRLVENKGPETLSEMDSNSAYQSRFSHPMSQDGMMSQDAFSPAESMGQSPEAGYSPIDSPADLGSSPPVPRTSAYIRSSPPASSPVLPSMPLPVSQVDSGFMSGGIDDIFEDDDLLQEKAGNGPSLPMPNRLTQTTTESQPQAFPAHFPFHEVHPGPPELLPTTSIFKPHGKTRALNRPPKPPSRTLTRCQTAPALHSEPIERPEVQLARQHAFDQASHPPAHSEEPQPPPPSDIETVLQEALNQAVGNEASGTQCSAAVAAPFEPMPIPERPVGELGLTLPTLPTSRPASRSASQAPSAPPAAPAPATESPAEPVLPVAKCPGSEAPDPFDDDQPRYSKNQVKKQTIKERLEAAILNGESPPFCNNCGAIETPTWRKIWVQEHKGAPPPTDKKDFSDKPGFLTTVDVLERNADGEPMAYRLIKKHLGPKEDKKKWSESVLCNPCGIWLQKFKGHRPQDRWDKDAARLGQPRRKRDNKNGNGKGKNARSKSESQMNLTSEAYFPTDPLGPPDMPDSPKAASYDGATTNNGNQATQEYQSELLNLRSSPKHRGPGSTHSRGSGTADSPIALDDDLGPTRRLLFPSPKKDGMAKVLGELTANGTQPTTTAQERKSAAEGKENATVIPARPGTPVQTEKDDLDQELFGTPPNRPSTPPAKSMSSGVFKTPTRPTPSHRPITRSISRSIRSVRTVVPQSPSGHGPGFGHLLKTPSKTPRSSGVLGQLSMSKRRSPRNAQLLHAAHAHFSLDDVFDSPFTATLNQLLSEANEFTAGSPSHGLLDVELNTLPALSASGGGGPSALDFGHFLNSTDLPMPSSPPLARHHGSAMDFGLGQSFHGGDIWGQFEGGDVAEEMEGINLP